MASLYITEYAKLAREDFSGPSGVIQTGMEPNIADQKLTIGSSSVASDLLHKDTRLVMIHTDAICHVAIGPDPTASTGHRRIPADATVYYGIPPHVRLKIAVITGT